MAALTLCHEQHGFFHLLQWHIGSAIGVAPSAKANSTSGFQRYLDSQSSSRITGKADPFKEMLDFVWPTIVNIKYSAKLRKAIAAEPGIPLSKEDVEKFGEVIAWAAEGLAPDVQTVRSTALHRPFESLRPRDRPQPLPPLPRCHRSG